VHRPEIFRGRVAAMWWDAGSAAGSLRCWRPAQRAKDAGLPLSPRVAAARRFRSGGALRVARAKSNLREKDETRASCAR